MNINKFMKNKKAPYKIVAIDPIDDKETVAHYYNKDRADFCLWRFLINGFAAELFVK